jgi:rhodanese-related sulfurtransferase
MPGEEVKNVATTLMEMVQDARKTVREVGAQEAANELDRGDGALLIDVREPWEFARGHIPGAVNIPRGMLELKADAASPMADPDLVGRRQDAIILYCLRTPGARSVLATETLARMGYANVAAIAGGLLSWRDQGFPVETSATEGAETERTH